MRETPLFQVLPGGGVVQCTGAVAVSLSPDSPLDLVLVNGAPIAAGDVVPVRGDAVQVAPHPRRMGIAMRAAGSNNSRVDHAALVYWTAGELVMPRRRGPIAYPTTELQGALTVGVDRYMATFPCVGYTVGNLRGYLAGGGPITVTVALVMHDPGSGVRRKQVLGGVALNPSTAPATVGGGPGSQGIWSWDDAQNYPLVADEIEVWGNAASAAGSTFLQLDLVR